MLGWLVSLLACFCKGDRIDLLGERVEPWYFGLNHVYNYSLILLQACLNVHSIIMLIQVSANYIQ